MILSAEERSIWYSLSASVSAGATTMLSPVCTPMGSTFSMLQIAIVLPTLSRMVSNSISFQPYIYFSTSIWPIGEASIPAVATERISSSLYATPPPVPPSVKAGRMMTGYPIPAAIAIAVSMSVAISEGTVGSPIERMVSLKSCLSSALSITSVLVPISRTPNFSSIPFLLSCMASVRPV